MTNKVEVEELRRKLFFRGLPPDFLDFVAEISEFKSFDDGDVIIHEEKEADKFYLIKSGRLDVQVKIRKSTSLTIAKLGVGEVAGWSWLVPPHRSCFEVVAHGPCQTIVIDGSQLRDFCEKDPKLYNLLYRKVCPIINMRFHELKSILIEKIVWKNQKAFLEPSVSDY